MNFVLDTSAYSQFNRGDDRLLKWFDQDNEIAVPVIVVGELRAGFSLGNRKAVNEALLQKFLDSPNVSIVSITDRTTSLFAEIYSKLRKNGTPIGTNDIWIAAITLELDSMLLTLDTDFNYVPDLLVAVV